MNIVITLCILKFGKYCYHDSHLQTTKLSHLEIGYIFLFKCWPASCIGQPMPPVLASLCPSPRILDADQHSDRLVHIIYVFRNHFDTCQSNITMLVLSVRVVKIEVTKSDHL